MYKIVLLGPPGSGKGTQAEFLVVELNIPTVSTGNIFRAETKSGTELGKQVEEILKTGALVSDELTNQIVKNRLTQSDVAQGFILDGYPRTIPQVEFLNSLVEITMALNIDASDEVVTKRMAARRMCSQCGANFNILFKPTKQVGICDKCGGELYIREDAKPEAIAERLKVYHGQIDPILDYYKEQGVLINIDGEPNINEVWQEIKNKLSL